MELIEQLAQAALKRDSLLLRSLVQDWVRSGRPASELNRPQTEDAKVLVISAALAELLAERQGQNPPAWTQEIGALSEPFFMLEAASSISLGTVLVVVDSCRCRGLLFRVLSGRK